jgi:hypothetical protein
MQINIDRRVVVALRLLITALVAYFGLTVTKDDAAESAAGNAALEVAEAPDGAPDADKVEDSATSEGKDGAKAETYGSAGAVVLITLLTNLVKGKTAGEDDGAGDDEAGPTGLWVKAKGVKYFVVGGDRPSATNTGLLVVSEKGGEPKWIKASEVDELVLGSASSEMKPST